MTSTSMPSIKTLMSLDDGERCGDTIIIRTTEAKLREAEERLRSIQNLNTIPAYLRKLSAVACIFHFTQALCLSILASRAHEQYYLYTFFPSHEKITIGSETSLDGSLYTLPRSNPYGAEPNPTQIAAFSALWYSPVFIVMSAVENLCSILFRDTYEYYLARNQNPFRWTEYSFSASLMRVMIAQLVGITDVHVLFCIFVMALTCVQCAFTHETINAKARADGYEQNWRAFFLGWLPHIATWGIILSYFHDQVHNGGQPAFLWAIIVFLFIWEACFPIVFILQWKKIGPFQDFIYSEMIYIMLGFSAKTLLAWVSFAGIYE